MKEVKPLGQLLSLKNKNSIITGAASGIGRAIARRYAEAGSDLVLIDINKQGLEEVKEELRKFKVKIKTHKVNLQNKKEIEKLWEKLSENMPDILINNAGIYPFKKFIEITEEDYRAIMDINLNSVFWMCQRFIQGRGKNGGIIVNVGSIEGILPFKKDLAHYGISKAGVMSLTRSLAREYGRDGFRVNCIVPGGVVTFGTKEAAKLIFKFKAGLVNTAIKFKSRLALGRLGDPDEIAKMSLVLASDASSYMQGALVAVDGGFLSA